MKVKEFIKNMKEIRKGYKKYHFTDPYECEMTIDITTCLDPKLIGIGILEFDSINDAIISFKTTCQLEKEKQDLKKFWEKRNEK